MADYFVISYDGVDYRWAPTKSTPSAKDAITELPEIIQHLQNRGVKCVVDFGAGRGRNVQPLSESFDHVILVEDEANIPGLSNLVNEKDIKNCTIDSWDKFRRQRRPKVDAVFICFVIHTLPSQNMRVKITRTNTSRLRRKGVLVFVTPRKDPKYTPKFLADAAEFDDGIVRLYQNQTFSFYRNYTKDEFIAFLTHAGLRVDDAIPSDRRMIFLTSSVR